MPKVTVIIPCYNQAAFLPKAITSLQAQTLADWECIIVDDGSTDNSAEVAANSALKDPRIRFFQQLNSGSAAARESGLQKAKGQYIQFLDADDTIAPEKLERQVALMSSQRLDISYTAFCSEDKAGLRTPTRSIRLNLHRVLVQWGLGASIPIHAFLHRTEFIQRNQLRFISDCRAREDWKWHISCLLLKPAIASLPDYCGAIYYQNEQGKTGSYVKMQKGNFAFMAYMSERLKGWNKCLWTYRLSEELWVWLLRMLKYHSTQSAGTIKPVVIKTGFLLGAVMLMPLSVWSVLCYFIKTYIAR